MGKSLMTTMIMQSLTFIIFTVSEKTEMLKFLPHMNALPVGPTLIIMLTHIFHVSYVSQKWVKL